MERMDRNGKNILKDVIKILESTCKGSYIREMVKTTLYFMIYMLSKAHYPHSIHLGFIWFHI